MIYELVGREIMSKTKVIIPYSVIGLFATNIGEAVRLSEGRDISARFLSFFQILPEALSNPAPSLHPFDLLVGAACAALFYLAVRIRRMDAKKYRQGVEYGSARWGTKKDIAPFMNPVFENNVILTASERLTM